MDPRVNVYGPGLRTLQLTKKFGSQKRIINPYKSLRIGVLKEKS